MSLLSESRGIKILEEEFGTQQLIKLFNTETKEFAAILPETGGMLLSLELLLDNELRSVLDTYHSDQELSDELRNSYKGITLFPFPNRIDAGKYSFEENDYQLIVNHPQENNAIHGLVFDKKFDVIEKNESGNSAKLVLRYQSKGDLSGYPFQFEQTIEYTFDTNKGLSINTIMKNTDSGNIPVGLGWHPYFSLKSKMDEIVLSFPSEEIYEVDERMLPTGNTSKFTTYVDPRTIGEDKFDSCFKVPVTGKKAEINIFDPSIKSGITIWQETGDKKYNFLQIFIPDHRKSIAIEPMTCIPDTFNNKTGLITLKPGEVQSVEYGISLM